jgi:hypothetical protein
MSPVGKYPRQQEAREPAGSLGKHQEHVAHRRRGEPLVTGQPVAAVAGRLGAGGVRADVRAALLLGHRHAGQQAALGQRGPQAEVVRTRPQQRLVRRGEGRLVPQRRHDRVRHRDRAAVAGLGGAPHVEAGRAGDVRAGPRGTPRRGVQAVLHGDRHQRMPGGMELDLVDAVAEPVVGAQPRRVLVGQPAPVLRLRRAGQDTELAHARQRPVRALTAERGQQSRIAGDVVAGQRRRLVGHFVCSGQCATSLPAGAF